MATKRKTMEETEKLLLFLYLHNTKQENKWLLANYSSESLGHSPGYQMRNSQQNLKQGYIRLDLMSLSAP